MRALWHPGGKSGGGEQPSVEMASGLLGRIPGGARMHSVQAGSARTVFLGVLQALWEPGLEREKV